MVQRSFSTTEGQLAPAPWKPYPWEELLLAKAMDGLKEQRAERTFHYPLGDLEKCFEICGDITRQKSQTFYFACRLLPAEKRKAIWALYAFARTSDDIADSDGDPEEKLRRLKTWHQALRGEDPGNDPVLVAWSETRRRFRIPTLYEDHLLEALEQDLRLVRYERFDDLAHYCYGVASTIGLMSMHILGYTSDYAFLYAIRLGVALQLTNILRDVGEDWEQGRLYLPREELQGFGLTEEDIARGVVDERWRAFMRFQIERVERLYERSLPGIAYLHPRGQLAVAAAGELYRKILRAIERNDYNVFTRRAIVPGWQKVLGLFPVLFRVYTGWYARQLSKARDMK
jgi:phytoene synthase